MGEGFLLRLLPALPPPPALGGRREARVFGTLPDQATTPNHPLVPRTCGRIDLFDGHVNGETDAVTGRRLGASATPTSGSRTPCAAGSLPPPQRRRRRVRTVESGHRARDAFGALEGQGDYVMLPRDHAPLGADRAHAAAGLRDRGHQPSPRPLPLPVPGSCWSTLLRGGTCAPGRAAAGRHRGARSRSTSQAAGAPGPVASREPCVVPGAPVRRGRLGRLPLPVRLQHRRLRADHPAGSTSRRRCTRSSRAATVICNFVPRKVDYHPCRRSWCHYRSNVDSDEVMFYVGGDYEARWGSGGPALSRSASTPAGARSPAGRLQEGPSAGLLSDELAVTWSTPFRPLGARRRPDSRRRRRLAATSWVRGQTWYDAPRRRRDLPARRAAPQRGGASAHSRTAWRRIAALVGPLVVGLSPTCRRWPRRRGPCRRAAWTSRSPSLAARPGPASIRSAGSGPPGWSRSRSPSPRTTAPRTWCPRHCRWSGSRPGSLVHVELPCDERGLPLLAELADVALKVIANRCAELYPGGGVSRHRHRGGARASIQGDRRVAPRGPQHRPGDGVASTYSSTRFRSSMSRSPGPAATRCVRRAERDAPGLPSRGRARDPAHVPLLRHPQHCRARRRAGRPAC